MRDVVPGAGRRASGMRTPGFVAPGAVLRLAAPTGRHRALPAVTAATATTTTGATGTTPEADVRAADEAVVAEGWSTVVWNDPVNLMSYVTYVFRSYFGYTQARAETLMMQVHREGRAVVSRGNREQMEIDVQAMHGFGLWATVQPVGA